MDFTTLSGNISDVIVLVLGIVITRYLVPYLKEKYGAEKVKATTEKTISIYSEIEKAVKAMAKKYPESGFGTMRREEVIKYIRSKGFDISDADLDIAIECAVKVLDLLESQLTTTPKQ